MKQDIVSHSEFITECAKIKILHSWWFENDNLAGINGNPLKLRGFFYF